MMGLRETLEAATPGPWKYHRIEDDGYGEPSEDVRGPNGGIVSMGERCYVPATETANLHLIALAPELAALALDMGEALRLAWDEDTWDEFLETDTTALLARLDQLGKGQT